MLKLRGDHGYSGVSYTFVVDGVSELWDQLINHNLVSEEDYDNVLEKKYNVKLDNMTDEEIESFIHNKYLNEVEWLDLIVERCSGNMDRVEITFDCWFCECEVNVNERIFNITDADSEVVVIANDEDHRIKLLNKLLDDECPLCDKWEELKC